MIDAWDIKNEIMKKQSNKIKKKIIDDSKERKGVKMKGKKIKARLGSLHPTYLSFGVGSGSGFRFGLGWDVDYVER